MTPRERNYKMHLCGALLTAGFTAQRHEDSVSRYIPDISFAGFGNDGWIEVKMLTAVPRKFNIKHFTRGQESWLRERGNAGRGWCYLLVVTPVNQWLWRWDAFRKIRDLPWNTATRWAAEGFHGTDPRLVAGWLYRRV